METIKLYIENLFQTLPDTNEVKKAKKELLEMMEDKYNEWKSQGKSENEAIGIVISEFGNIDELKEELGVSKRTAVVSETPVRRISLEEVTEFLQNTKTFAIRITIGVVLCILSVLPLIFFCTSLDVERVNVWDWDFSFETAMNEGQEMTVIIGVLILLVFIAIAVSLFILNGLKYKKYDYLTKEVFELKTDALSLVKEKKEQYASTFAVQIVLGVVLCIIGVIPLVLLSYIADSRNDATLAGFGICVFLTIIAAAVSLFVLAGVKMDAYKKLLQEEEYARGHKNNEQLVERIAAVYWPTVVAVYLLISFLSSEWGRTWVIWPVAGVLFGAVAAFFSTKDSEKK